MTRLQRLATKTMLAKGYTQLVNLNQAKIPYQNTVLAVQQGRHGEQSEIL